MKLCMVQQNWRGKISIKLKRASQTAGREKTLSCQASAMDKFFAKRSRSYKHKDYHNWSLRYLE